MNVASTATMHRRLYDLTAEAMREEVALAEAAGFATEAKHEGVLQTLRASDVGRARAYVETSNRLGLSIELWSEEKTRAALGIRDCAGALFDPHGGHVDPMQLTRGLGAAAASAGALVFEDSPVVGVEEGETLRVHLAGGQTVRAPAAVLATNAFTTQLGFFRNAVFPAHNYMAITAPLSSSSSRARACAATSPSPIPATTSSTRG